MSAQKRGGLDERRSGGAQAPVSLLLRCWLEPQEGAGPVVRGMIRNLLTGEETPIGDVDALGGQVLRHLGWGRAVDGGAGRRLDCREERSTG